MITLELLTPQNAMVFKYVRLRALQDTPTAFSSTYAEGSKLTDDAWVKRAAQWSGAKSVDISRWTAALGLVSRREF